MWGNPGYLEGSMKYPVNSWGSSWQLASNSRHEWTEPSHNTIHGCSLFRVFYFSSEASVIRNQKQPDLAKLCLCCWSTEPVNIGNCYFTTGFVAIWIVASILKGSLNFVGRMETAEGQQAGRKSKEYTPDLTLHSLFSQFLMVLNIVWI